jgi:4-amino-4-deoxychorismate lyase
MGGDILVTLDGTVRDTSTPLIGGDDLGLLRGDGVFETALVVAGQPREWSAHLERMHRSARMLELELAAESRWRAATRIALDAYGPADELVLRLICTRGPEGGGAPTAFVRLARVPERTRRERRAGVRVALLELGVDPTLAARAPWLLRGAKTLSYAVNMAALREARRRGADDALFVATDGQVLEGPTCTVIVAGPGRVLRTPPPSLGILPGTTQRALFRAADADGWDTVTQPLTRSDLTAADAVWLVSSVRQAVAVHAVDEIELTARVPVEVATRLLNAGESAGPLPWMSDPKDCEMRDR